MVKAATAPAPEQGEQAADLAALEAMAADGLSPPGHLSETENQQEKGPSPAQMLGPFIGMMARASLSHYDLTPDLQQSEEAMLVESYVETIDHYFPDLDNVPRWLVPVFTTGMIITPRIIDKWGRDKAAKKTEQGDDKPGPAPAQPKPTPAPAPAQPDAMQAVGD